ncbi:MAG: hypothetical protein QN720_05680 [Nitrososphaeraceae archaeon]|nr:hypothetical protein [Nitrososphaeraceae archaeon]
MSSFSWTSPIPGACEIALDEAIVKLSKGFVRAYELELLLMAVGISLLLTGTGRISIE